MKHKFKFYCIQKKIYIQVKKLAIYTKIQTDRFEFYIKIINLSKFG